MVFVFNFVLIEILVQKNNIKIESAVFLFLLHICYHVIAWIIEFVAKDRTSPLPLLLQTQDFCYSWKEFFLDLKSCVQTNKSFDKSKNNCNLHTTKPSKTKSFWIASQNHAWIGSITLFSKRFLLKCTLNLQRLWTKENDVTYLLSHAKNCTLSKWCYRFLS